MKKLILGMTLLTSIAGFATDSEIIQNPKIEIDIRDNRIVETGYEDSFKTNFSCQSDLDSVCKRIDSSFTHATAHECNDLKLNPLEDKMSSLGSIISDGIYNLLTPSGSQVQRMASRGKLVHIYNIQKDSPEGVLDFSSYTYNNQYGLSWRNDPNSNLRGYRLLNSYESEGDDSNEDIEYLSQIECSRN